MRTRHAILVGLVMAPPACTASYPVAPLDPAPLGFQVFHANAHRPANIGTTYSFVAFAYRADGAYENVTAGAPWSSSEPAVVRPTAAGVFTAAAEGNARIQAQYRGASSFVSMSVIRQPSPFPYLSVFSAADPREIGATGSCILF